MDNFDVFRDRAQKLSGVKYSKKIKENFDKGLYREESLEEITQANNTSLKNIFNNYIIKDFIQWYENKISNNEADKIKKVAEWINIWTLYLQLEDKFDSNKLRKYERGDIVHVNFGFNVCSELGGSHYAVVVEKNNDRSNDTVIVVPLRSENGQLKEDYVIENLKKHEVLLGKNIIPIGEAKNNYSIAKINQIRTIAKLRITSPKKENDAAYPIDTEIRNDILDKIDKEILNTIFK